MFDEDEIIRPFLDHISNHGAKLGGFDRYARDGMKGIVLFYRGYNNAQAAVRLLRHEGPFYNQNGDEVNDPSDLSHVVDITAHFLEINGGREIRLYASRLRADSSQRQVLMPTFDRRDAWEVPLLNEKYLDMQSPILTRA